MRRVDTVRHLSARLAAWGLAAPLMAALLPSAHAGLFDREGENAKVELPTPPAPAFNADKTIAIDQRNTRSTEVGIDPATISSDSDGVVRYVLVARSPGGAITAIHEGIRCSTAEVKQYARHYRDGDWQPVAEPQWRSLYSGGTASYSLLAAKAGICQDAAPGGTSSRIVQNLQSDLMRRMP